MLIDTEIKEILDYISDRVIEKEKWNKVKNYITNLQECYIAKVDKYQEMILKCCELKQKNESLNNIINEYEQYLEDLGAWTYLDKLKELKRVNNE